MSPSRLRRRIEQQNTRQCGRPAAVRRGIAATLTAGIGLAAAACTSHSGGATPVAGNHTGVSTSPTGTGPTSAPSGSSAQVEVNPPGDIPDNQAFVPFVAAGYSVTVPEGWARTSRSGTVEFSDKYNSITLTTANSAAPPTSATARSQELPAIRNSAKGYTPGSISVVRRTAGTALLLTYRALSQVNPVTGKVANEAVERYEFWRGGHEVVLTLAAPVGSDNVDPWRRVTDSFVWTGK